MVYVTASTTFKLILYNYVGRSVLLRRTMSQSPITVRAALGTRNALTVVQYVLQF